MSSCRQLLRPTLPDRSTREVTALLGRKYLMGSLQKLAADAEATGSGVVVLLALELGDQLLRRDEPEGVFDDVLDVMPVDRGVLELVNEDSDPRPEDPGRAGSRRKEDKRVSRHQFFLAPGWRWAPDRYSAVAGEVGTVEVADGAFVAEEEARGSVAEALVDLWQRECD